MSQLNKITQLLGKASKAAEPIYNTLRSQTVRQYDNLMAGGTEYVVKDKAAADKLLKQWFYTNMAKVPVTIAEAKQEAGVLRSRLANFRELPVTEMATYVGFGAELYAWFCIGEIVGRGGSIAGYSV